MADPIQAKVDSLAQLPGLEVALLVFHPSPGAMEVRSSRAADLEKWSLVEDLARKYRADGESEEIAQSVHIGGKPHQLLATTVNPFLKHGTPFIVALVAGATVAEDLLETLRGTIQACMGAAYLR